MSGGLLINGKLVPVPGVEIIPPASHGGPSWNALIHGDAKARKVPWVRAGVPHSTKGMHPQGIAAGEGPRGRAQKTIEYWRRDPKYSGAHGTTGSDGIAACHADLALMAANHATVSNPWSFGWEIYQESDGTIFEAAIDATVKIFNVAFRELGIPRQFSADPYENKPLERLLGGGPDVVGCYGHRSNTATRGRGDPGDAFFRYLEADGWEPVHYATREDITLGKKRQLVLNGLGQKLTVDGICGPASMRAARFCGFDNWRDVA